MKPGRLSVSHLKRTFSFSLPNASRRAANLSWGTCPSGLFLLMRGKNQPCKMKLLKRPKNSIKQFTTKTKLFVWKKAKSSTPASLEGRIQRKREEPPRLQSPWTANSQNSWASALSSVQESMITVQYSSWPFAKEAKREPVADQPGALCLVCTASSRSRPGSAAPALRKVLLLY